MLLINIIILNSSFYTQFFIKLNLLFFKNKKITMKKSQNQNQLVNKYPNDPES